MDEKYTPAHEFSYSWGNKLIEVRNGLRKKMPERIVPAGVITREETSRKQLWCELSAFVARFVLAVTWNCTSMVIYIFWHTEEFLHEHPHKSNLISRSQYRNITILIQSILSMYVCCGRESQKINKIQYV